MKHDQAIRILDQLLGRCPMSEAERFAALAAFESLRAMAPDADAAARAAAAAEQLAAQRLADAEEAKAELGTAMETIALLRPALAEAQAEVARLFAAQSKSVGPA